MTAFYNEIDRAALAALSCVMEDGVIAPGRIEPRSIAELTADDLQGITQAHFFAGAGSWSYAARLAGWPDDRPLWTGSCPCQPFSQAGKRAGFADERHLWPDFYRLIRACRPGVVVGEQVSGAAGYAWLDGVITDLEREGYTCEAFDIPAAAVDAPHIRQRLYWAARLHADADRRGRTGRQEVPERIAEQRTAAEWHNGVVHAPRHGRREGRRELFGPGESGSPDRQRSSSELAGSHGCGVTLGDAERAGLEGFGWHGDGTPGWPVADRPVAAADGGELGHATSPRQFPAAHPELHRGEEGPGPRHAEPQRRDGADRDVDDADTQGRLQPQGRFAISGGRSCDTDARSFWSDAEWLQCHDGKARRTKPGLRLLAHGIPGRIHQWRIAGNSICIPLAVEFLRAVMEWLDET